jgi:hypothetical protein
MINELFLRAGNSVCFASSHPSLVDLPIHSKVFIPLFSFGFAHTFLLFHKRTKYCFCLIHVTNKKVKLSHKKSKTNQKNFPWASLIGILPLNNFSGLSPGRVM